MRNVDWEPVRDEGRAAFIRFQTLLTDLAAKDERWQFPKDIVPVIEGKSISLNYYETPEAGKSGTGEKAVRVTSGMSEFSSHGYLSMRGNEAWEFVRSETVGSQVADTLTKLLQEAGLSPKPEGAKESAGRHSHWFIWWNIYPANHPKITDPQK